MEEEIHCIELHAYNRSRYRHLNMYNHQTIMLLIQLTEGYDNWIYLFTKRSFFYTKEELETEVHGTQLQVTYHSAGLALYASGPFSCEQEALTTIVCLMHHRSNDEHILELRCCTSA